MGCETCPVSNVPAAKETGQGGGWLVWAITLGLGEERTFWMPRWNVTKEMTA